MAHRKWMKRKEYQNIVQFQSPGAFPTLSISFLSTPGWVIVLSACVNSDGRFWSKSYPKPSCSYHDTGFVDKPVRFPTNLARASFCCDVGKASAPKPTCSTCNWMFGQKNSQLVEGLWQENQNHTTIRFQDFGTWSWIAASMNLWVKPASWSLWGKNRKGARLLDVYWRWAANVLSAWMKQPMRLKKWINCFPLRLARMPECHKPREAAFWTNSLRCSHGESDGTRVLMNSRRTYIFGIGRPLETVRRCCWSLSSKGYASELKRSSLEFGEFGDLRFFTGVKAKWRRCHSPLPACWSNDFVKRCFFQCNKKRNDSRWVMPHISRLLGIQAHNFQISTPFVIISMGLIGSPRTSSHH